MICMGPLFCAEKYLLCWTLSSANFKSGVMYCFRFSEIGGRFVVMKGFFGRDPEPVFKIPLPFPVALGGAHCLMVRVLVLLAGVCPTSSWRWGQVHILQHLVR